MKTFQFPLIPIVLMILSIPINAQSSAASIGKRIQIAIPDLQPLGDISKEEISVISELITTEIANIPIFDILERQRATELYNEIAQQLTSGMVLDEAVMNTQIRGAGALLLGSYGKLFDRVVLTTRLVDLQTGRILIASSTITTQSALKESIHELAGAIQEKGRELNTIVSAKDIEAQVKARNWSEASRLMNIYLRTHPADDSQRPLFMKINDNLAETYYIQAQKYVKQGLFDGARAQIAEAIALKPDERFYGYREQISRNEQDWEYKRKLENSRKEAALASGKDASDWRSQIADSLSNITVNGTRVGASYSFSVDENNLGIAADGSDFGLELAWQHALRPSSGKDMLNWTWYAGTALRYEDIPGLGYSVLTQAYMSPLLAESFKLGNVALTLGADGGGLFWYGPVDPSGYLLGASAGASAILDIKINRSFGIFAMLKADFRWYPTDESMSAPSLRAAAGLTF
jgi:hypothetical protein